MVLSLQASFSGKQATFDRPSDRRTVTRSELKFVANLRMEY